MDNTEKRMTVLESIIQDVAKALFQKWANALPEDQQSEENIANLNKNATESTYLLFLIQWDASTMTGPSCQKHLLGDLWHCCLYSRHQRASKRIGIGW